MMWLLLQDSVPNTYSLELGSNSSAQTIQGETGISPTGKDLTDNYELDGSVDDNCSNCKPGETVGDEYDYANEKEFWEPASQEKELKMQVEKLTEVPVINNDALQ